MAGSNGQRTAYQESMYREHLKNVKRACHKIDCEPPKINPSVYLSNALLASAQVRIDEMEVQNRMLIQNISMTYRTKGGIDCHLKKTRQSSNYQSRLIRNIYLERENEILYDMIQNTKSAYSKQEQLESFAKEQKKDINKSKLAQNQSLDPLEKWSICPTDDDENPENIFSNPSKRVQCFFDLEIRGERKLGRMFIEIYKDYVPIAGENFLHFVRAESGLGYKNTTFYRIKRKFGLLGGDVENRNGASIATAYGRPFAHENHLLKFAGPGVVAAFTLVPGLNFCQFFITFKALPFLQNEFVVIGRVINNLRTLEMVEEFGTTSGVPKKPILIVNCGICQPQTKKFKESSSVKGI